MARRTIGRESRLPDGGVADRIDTVTRAIAVMRRDCRAAIGVAVDGDGERGGAGVAVGVGDRVGVGIREHLAVVQRIDHRVGVVHDIAVLAIGTQRERAVSARDADTDVSAHRAHVSCRHAGNRCLGRAGRIRAHAVGDVLRATAGHDVARDGRAILIGIGRIGVCRGRIVHDVDRERTVRGAVRIRHRQRDVVPGRVPRCGVEQRIGVAERSARRHATDRCVDLVTVELDGAIGRTDGDRAARGEVIEIGEGEYRAVDRDALEPVAGGEIDLAVHDVAVGTVGVIHQARLVDRRVTCRGTVVVLRRDHRIAVGLAVDGDRQCRRAGVAVRIGDRVGKRIGAGLAVLQGVQLGAVGIDQVCVATIRPERERAIGAGDAGTHVAAHRRAVRITRRHARDRRGGRVRADAVGHVGGTPRDDVAHHRRAVLVDVGLVGACGRRVIDDVDRQRAVRMVAAGVVDADRHIDLAFGPTGLCHRAGQREGVAERTLGGHATQRRGRHEAIEHERAVRRGNGLRVTRRELGKIRHGEGDVAQRVVVDRDAVQAIGRREVDRS